MDITEVLTLERLRYVGVGWEVNSGEKVVDQQRAEEDVRDLIAEREVLLDFIEAGPASKTHTMGAIQSYHACCGAYAERPHTEACWYGLRDAIIARARGQTVETTSPT